VKKIANDNENSKPISLLVFKKVPLSSLREVIGLYLRQMAMNVLNNLVFKFRGKSCEFLLSELLLLTKTKAHLGVYKHSSYNRFKIVNRL
jgi:hypothetical protein